MNPFEARLRAKNSTRSFIFSSVEEAAAERRRCKRQICIEPSLNAIRPPPHQHRSHDPNAYRLPDSTSTLVGPRLNLHNRVQSLFRAGVFDAASTVARHSVFSSTRRRCSLATRYCCQVLCEAVVSTKLLRFIATSLLMLLSVLPLSPIAISQKV